MIKQSIDIERLVTWALRDQGLGWTGDLSGGDSLAGLAELGTRVDSSSSGGLPPPGVGLQTSDDALDVRRAIDQLPTDARVLVILHGRIGTRPEWGEDGYGLPAQLLNKRGQKRWLYRDPRSQRGKVGPALDWRAYDHHIAQIDFERAQWTVWREALVALRVLLVTTQKHHEPSGPLVLAAPWVSIEDEGPIDVPYGQSMAARRAEAQAPIRPENVKWDYGPGKSTAPAGPQTPQNQASATAGDKRSTQGR